MAITDHRHRLEEARKPGFGIGLLKGMRVLLKHLFKHNTVIEYPKVKQDLSSRTRGVIALKEENCTVCMLCGRECPDWCIYIDSHKETLPPKREGGRQRKRNVLDRFAIDYALCMYCGICVEVCPYDALFWSREFEYAEYDIRELTHEKEKLADWMDSVLPPPPLEPGAEGLPGETPAAQQTTTAATAARPATETSSAAAVRPAQAAAAPAQPTAAPTAAKAKTAEPGVSEERAEGAATVQPPVEEKEREEAPATAPTEEREGEPAPKIEEEARAEQQVAGAPEAEAPPAAVAEAQVEVPQVTVPHEEPHPAPLEPVEDPQSVYDEVLKEQLEAGSSPQVAQARAKVARVKAERGIRRGPTPVEVEKPVPSAPTKAEQQAEQQAATEEPPPRAAAPPGSKPSGEAEQQAPRIEPPAGGGAPPGSTPSLSRPPETPPSSAEARPSEADEASTAGDGPLAGDEAIPGGAPRGVEPQPEQGPVAPTPAEAAAADDPDAVFERVLREEQAKGSSAPVAEARAKAARIRALKGTKGPDS
jgi:formate hydrogenlyase subunit 6/NADH:ubiquinone oxidoreductase subunit I